MEQQTDIRWIQRYANYHKACARLLAVTDSDRFLEDLSELEIEGLVQRFEYTFELAWKVLQDLLIYKGYEFGKPKEEAPVEVQESKVLIDKILGLVLLLAPFVLC